MNETKIAVSIIGEEMTAIISISLTNFFDQYIVKEKIRNYIETILEEAKKEASEDGRVIKEKNEIDKLKNNFYEWKRLETIKIFIKRKIELINYISENEKEEIEKKINENLFNQEQLLNEVEEYLENQKNKKAIKKLLKLSISR